MSNLSLEIGKTYFTSGNVAVIPLKQLEKDRALFVSNDFYPTPFIVWTYQIVDTTEIRLYSGTYYTDFDKAVADISDPDQDMPKMLGVNFYCPACEETTGVSTLLSGSVSSISERLSNDQFCHLCHGRCGGATHIELADKDNIYR